MPKLKGSEIFEKISKKGNPIDFDKIYREIEAERKRDAKIAEEKAKKEKERLSNIKCPLCKSKNKNHVVKSENNGVMGPGYSSWETENYYVCLDCGIMYKDLEKFKKNG
jgi:transposase-like protein